jgi:AraC-like DNA-binding protein
MLGSMADGLVLTRRESERGVHETAQRAGEGAGAELVRHYVGYEEWADADFLRREMARHGVALIFGFGDAMDVYEGSVDGSARRLRAFVVGSQMGPSLTGVGGHQCGVQVELWPAGALALFGEVEALTDAVVPLDAALGARGTRLLELLAETATWAERLSLLDDALRSFAGEELPQPAPEVEWLRRQLVATCGTARVEPLMDETGWSRRHVTERFRRQLGVTPKAYARLLRFEQASALLTTLAERPGRTVADVAMAAGYYDQSHLTREFAGLAGLTPGRVAADAALAPEVRFVQDHAASMRSE